MKNLNYLNEFRIPHPVYKDDMGDEFNGAFKIKIKGEEYYIMASNGMDWEHVSISSAKTHKIPSWNVMCELKDLFFEEEECVFQYHPAKSNYINNHKACLHLWKPIKETIPVPPNILIGIK